MKKILVILMVLSLISSSFAFASSDIMLISSNPNTSSTNTITFNGVTLEKPYVIDKDGDILLPLKPIADAFGYQLTWNSKDRSIEMIKGARYILLKTKVNLVSFSKMAPTALSKKAVFIGGSTYVPKDFVETYFEGIVNESAGNVEILSHFEESVNTTGLVITSIEKDRIIVSQNGGESHIMFNQDTTYFDYKTQKSIKLSDLKVGDTLKVTHPSMMILIYPAQYSAIHIERINEVAYLEGSIISINEDSILVKGTNMDVQINFDKKTVIKNTNGIKIESKVLRVGNKVSVYHSLAMTRSLPPQTYGYSITVDTFLK